MTSYFELDYYEELFPILRFDLVTILNAIVFSSLLVIVCVLFRRSKRFASTFGLTTMIVLYVLSILRIAFPLTFSRWGGGIRDPYVMTAIYDVLTNQYEVLKPLPPIKYIVLGIIIAFVVVLSIVYAVKNSRYMCTVRSLENHATDHEREILSSVTAKLFKKPTDIKLIKTDFVQIAMVTGLRDTIILLPNIDYTDAELELIFLHECTHIKNKDLWVKLLVQVYCILFWFNPVAYLLKADIDSTLELKCDACVIQDMPYSKRLDYAQVMLDSIKQISNPKKPQSYLVASGFFKEPDDKKLEERFTLVIEPKRKTKAIHYIALFLCFAIIIGCSYFIPWVPHHDADKAVDDSEIQGDAYSTSENAYLIEQEDGNYLFYFDGFEVFVDKLEVELGMYDSYPIYEHGDAP